jgi:hypothetical protein
MTDIPHIVTTTPFKMFIWRGHGEWIVMCFARSVAEARKMIHEDPGPGDWSTPVRNRMMKDVEETTPERHQYEGCGEAVLTFTGEIEEMEAYIEIQRRRIVQLKAALKAIRETHEPEHEGFSCLLCATAEAVLTEER